MQEIEVGTRIDEQGNLSAFGTEEVNERIRAGARVVSIEPGGALMRKVGEGEGSVRISLVGFTLKVRLDSSRPVEGQMR